MIYRYARMIVYKYCRFMHIPGQFHLYDLNKYIAALLVPVFLVQSLEALIIPITLADNVVSGEIQLESQLLDVSRIPEQEDPDDEIKKAIQEQQKEAQELIEKAKRVQMQASTGLISGGTVVKVGDNIQKKAEVTVETKKLEVKKIVDPVDVFTEMSDKKGKKRRIRLIKNDIGKVKEAITADVIEVGNAIKKNNVTATISSGTVLMAQDAVIEKPEALAIDTPTAYDLAGANTTKTVDSFTFGIPGEDIIFSHPVRIDLSTTLANGTLVDLQVRHGNDIDFSRK